ncbi:uncharacterized protein N7484_004584 [Penicillium longicatenatum]|uniref:uncharacterized protein n=1 Tax=Penicillium longicatenatum TaxID=1561947 RepID=UPI00254776A7|nr:uncharacterized protein N7484_004584 [Penicillium longicatenatum]KAJ5650861.1 hypothetical protein N7484_004584 [Penicillium longicatenatum]
MSRTRRQWLGFFLALFIISMLYRHRHSLNEYHAQQTTPINEHIAPPDAPSPDIPKPDFQNPDFPSEPPLDKQSHNTIWSRLPIRHLVVPSLLPPTQSRLGIPKIQASESSFSQITTWFQKSRQAAVKEAFTRCWDSYKWLAWQTDELTPMSGLPSNGLGGWGVTLVDNLDTLWIMGMRSEFDIAVKAVVEINFETTQSSEINTHEINIRILGGLLGAFDLSADRRLLNKAIEVGDMLYAAFDTPNRMPITHWDLHRAARQEEQFAEEMVSASELGSFILEFTRLSQLTSDPKYFNAAQLVMEILSQLQDLTKLPGMWPVVLNARTEVFDGDFFTLGAEVDSLYKTLAKADMLLGGRFPVYRKMYERSTRTAAGHSLFRPMTHDNKDILVPGSIRVMMTQNGKSRTLLESQVHHRACFTGGMFALGGALFSIPAHRQIANKLVDGCIWAAQSMPLGIMPEVYETIPCASQNDCPWNEWHWKQEVWKSVNNSPEPDPDMDIDAYIRDHHLPKGFIAIPDSRYNLRPETIESMFNLYRISAREDLLDTAWGMFESIQNTTEIINGNAALADVTTPTEDPVHIDSMESFWMSQTLKYFYLMFSAPDALSLDEYVFNSAGHPLKRPETEWIQ